MKYQQIALVSDESGHDYVIPYERKEEFNRIIRQSITLEDYSEFENKFSQYRISVLPDLFIKVEC